MRIPLMITLLRLALIPVFTVFFYLPFLWAHIISAAIFALAAITDWLDGFLARRLNQTTKFGAFLDPVADKLMVVIALVLIVGSHRYSYISIPAAIIVGREIAISALREWMAEIGKRTSVAVSFVGKIKTTVQFLAIITLLLANPWISHWYRVSGYVLLYAASILTLWTMVMYLKSAWPDFTIDH